MGPSKQREGLDNDHKCIKYCRKSCKNSSYRVVTRVNLIYGDGINPFPEATNARPKDVFDLQGIDFIGVDAYKDNVKHLKNEVMAYASIAGNYALVAENKGSYANSPESYLDIFRIRRRL